MSEIVSSIDDLELDDDQKRAKAVLDHCLDQQSFQKKSKGFLSRLLTIQDSDETYGLYLYGPSGRGKTVLMDWFFNQLKGVPKKRVHFHNFMIEVHDALHAARTDTKDSENDTRVEQLAAEMAKDFDILCFDEFHVTDVADAMILHPLITGFIKAGVFIIVTTNWPPENLYEDGLQRERFLPFIDLIEDHFKQLSFLSGPDYRQTFKDNAPRWLLPLNKESHDQFNRIISILTKDKPPKETEIEILGERSEPFLMANNMLITQADDLLSRDLGPREFIKLVEHCKAVFLDDLKPFSKSSNEKAKRFMTLIDVLYDADVALFVRADCQPEDLYQGKRLQYEFQRTISRLYEMRQKSDPSKRVKKG